MFKLFCFFYLLLNVSDDIVNCECGCVQGEAVYEYKSVRFVPLTSSHGAVGHVVALSLSAGRDCLVVVLDDNGALRHMKLLPQVHLV